MRRFKIALTSILGVFVLFDAIVGYRLWESGWPKDISLTSGPNGVGSVQVTPISFTSLDWLILGAVIVVQLMLFCLVWKAWREPHLRA